MKKKFVGIALLVIATSASVQAQSLEKSYADLCSTPAQRESEACQVMAKALIAKLQGASDGKGLRSDAPPPVAEPVRESAGESGRSVNGWGVYADLAGKTWLVYDKGAFNSFYIIKFRQEGRRMISDSTLYTAASQIPTRSVISLLPDGRLQHEGGKNFGDVANDGSVTFASRSALGRQKVLSTVRHVNGQIVGLFADEPGRPFVYNEVSDDEIPQLVAEWHERREARERERAALRQARWDQFNAVLSGVTAALSEVQQVTRAAALSSSAGVGLPKTVETANTITAGAPESVGTAAGAPLRFVLTINLQNKLGDTVNPTCYSNVIVRPGPAGWGRGGSLPPGSEGAARGTVEGMKSAFIAACEAASGRKVTSQGDFQWMWNEFRDGESQIANARARYREDVTVNL